MIILLLLHFPDPAEAPWANLIEKLIVITAFFFDLLRFTFERSRDIGVVIANEGCLVPVFFHWFFDGFGLWGSGPEFQIFYWVCVLRANEDPGGFGDIHVQCELEVDFVTFLVDFEKKVGCGGGLLLFFLNFFDHFLSKTLILKFKNIIYRQSQYPTGKILPAEVLHRSSSQD